MLRKADKTVVFGTKTADYAANNPAFVPGFADAAKLKQGTAGVAALAPLRQQCERALDLDLTVRVAGSEAYGNALTVQGNIRSQSSPVGLIAGVRPGAATPVGPAARPRRRPRR